MAKTPAVGKKAAKTPKKVKNSQTNSIITTTTNYELFKY